MPPIDTTKLLILVVLGVGMLFVVYSELKILRRKSRERSRASLAKDEAFNTVLTTRSVIVSMQRQGAKTEKAQMLVDQAKQALDMGDSDRAKDLCDMARRELTGPPRQEAPEEPNARRSVVGEGRADENSLLKVADEIVSSGSARRIADEYRGSKLPVGEDGNYLSAKFEMSTARTSIRNTGERGGDTSTASRLLADAEEAFAAGNYTKALSLALKSRRSVNRVAEEEAIKLKREPEEEREPREEPPSLEEPAERAGACASCGAEMGADDVFCHRCGRKTETERECASCGTVAKAGDVFCRKCGSKVG